eukprot:14208831-Heterocapsa_arctica.AAC.1
MPTQSARDFASTMKARSKSVGSISGLWPQAGDDVPPVAAAAAECLGAATGTRTPRNQSVPMHR